MNKPFQAEKPWLEYAAPVLTVIFLILACLYVMSPALRSLAQPYDCLLYQSTGLLCPACGGTRAMIHLVNGEYLIAIRSNVLAVLALPLVGYAAVTAFRLAFSRHFNSADIRIAPVWIWSIFAAVIIFWVIRNIPYFSFLRPLF